jgi:hypothetical protein
LWERKHGKLQNLRKCNSAIFSDTLKHRLSALRL